MCTIHLVGAIVHRGGGGGGGGGFGAAGAQRLGTGADIGAGRW